jgi:hypothetical protein
VCHLSHPSHPDKLNKVCLPFFIATSQILTQCFIRDIKACSSCHFSLNTTVTRIISAQTTPHISLCCLHSVFIGLLTTEAPTVIHKFNISDTKTLEVHFHSHMFRWRIYTIIREREFTPKAEKPLARKSPTCYVHIVRVTPQKLKSLEHGRRCIRLYTHCKSLLHTAYPGMAL